MAHESKPRTLSRLGTRAFKQLAKNGRMMGFVKLKDITGLDVNGLYEIFSWVGLERKADETKTIDLVEKYYYLQNTGLMFDDQTGVEYKKKIYLTSTISMISLVVRLIKKHSNTC